MLICVINYVEKKTHEKSLLTSFMGFLWIISLILQENTYPRKTYNHHDHTRKQYTKHNRCNR